MSVRCERAAFLATRVVCLLLFAFGAARAQADTAPAVSAQIASSRHTIVIGGKTLAYTANAGLIPIRHNDDGSVRAHMFFVAYIADRAAGNPPRPLTFAWNGGPGANSLLLHLSAFGPRRLDGAGHGDSGASVHFVDNLETLLSRTDLVFVDPVGTGFSRPTDPRFALDFYGVREDIAVTREFIRSYRTRFDAWDAPVYLAGESYGTWRAMGTAEAMEQNGEHVAGVVLLSGGIPVGPLVSREMRAALFVPARVATAAFHHRLAPELQSNPSRGEREAEEWGRTVYVPALLRRDSLSARERSGVIARLAYFTGLDSGTIDGKTLMVDRRMLLQNLLKDRGTLGTFDTRQVAHAPTPAEVSEETDRRFLITRYLRDELGFLTDLAYQGLELGYSSSTPSRDPNAEWKWDQGVPGVPLIPTDDGPPGGAAPWVQGTFAVNHRIRVFVGSGRYDSLNSCALIAYQVSQLEPQVRERITLGCYEGGHMMYEDRGARVALRRDLGQFYDAGSR